MISFVQRANDDQEANIKESGFLIIILVSKSRFLSIHTKVTKIFRMRTRNQLCFDSVYRKHYRANAYLRVKSI